MRSPSTTSGPTPDSAIRSASEYWRSTLRREEPLEAGPVGVEHGPDRGEGEALRLEIPDPGEPVEVLGAVELVPAGAFGRRQQVLAGVVADRVDRHAGPLGQLVDPPAGRHGASGRAALP